MSQSLNTKQVEALIRANREGRHRTAPGLYLQVEPPKPGIGARASWLFRYQIAGRSRAMGLGAYGDVTLAQARQKAEEARTLVASIAGGPPTLRAALRAFEEAGIELRDVGLRRPTLDDVFLTLTGHAAVVADSAADDARPAPVEA